MQRRGELSRCKQAICFYGWSFSSHFFIRHALLELRPLSNPCHDEAIAVTQRENDGGVCYNQCKCFRS